MTYLLLPMTFLFVFLGCLLIIRLSGKYQWLDRPNGRSSHSRPTPTGGGLAIVIIFSLSALLVFADNSPGFNHVLVLVPALAVAAIGLADDIFSLGIWPRICVQLLAVICALALFGIPAVPVFSFILEPGLFGYLFAAWFFLWFINLFNFMDGIDGLAGAEFIFICLAVVFLTMGGENTGTTDFLLLLVAAVSGFLLLNLAPARIFMGDVGSNFLGYLLGVMALASTVSGNTTLWTWLILAAVFIIDATSTLCIRVMKGEKWYYAHRSHAYQRAASHLGSHGSVVVLVSLINCCWLLPLAWMAHNNPGMGFVLTMVACAPLLFLVRYLSKFPAVSQIA